MDVVDSDEDDIELLKVKRKSDRPPSSLDSDDQVVFEVEDSEDDENGCTSSTDRSSEPRELVERPEVCLVPVRPDAESTEPQSGPESLSLGGSETVVLQLDDSDDDGVAREEGHFIDV